MSKRTTRILAASTIATLGMGAGSLAMAQGGNAAAAGQTQQATPDFSDEQIDKFAEAQARVAEIGEKWNARMQSADNPEEAQKARQSAQQEMVIAVENSGLSVQEYNQIAQAAQTNPELRERLSQ